MPDFWDEFQDAGKFEPSTMKAGPINFRFTKSGGNEEKNLDIQSKKLDIAKKQKELNKATAEKIPAAQLGYYTMADASMKDYEDLQEKLTSGKLTHDDIRIAFGRTPTDQTAIINNILYNGTDAWLRIQTGAQANPSEIAREMAKFQPKAWDSDNVIDYKLKSLFENRLGRYKETLEKNSGVTPIKKGQTDSKAVIEPKKTTASDVLKKYGLAK